ncbi:PilZ domain-containing protein [Sphingomonas morindae]|uniref:PilZ domain-containing protein n=1 Tax=Sphingomonas morindae TaxID=1541170 RepID=A0ABY4X6W1_9SPHN|nr:PilZ domain-containing protein [Sphingomonas morindae]USI72624.1 hypothetical protein LHA26_15275 [Sphingomonas morindae]
MRIEMFGSETLPISQAPEDRRAAQRHATSIAAVVETHDGIALAAEIANLSRTGFCARCALSLPRGARVKVRVGDAIRRRPAEVIWQFGQEIGCRFVTPLPQKLLATLIDG